jgi:hypothetical protein
MRRNLAARAPGHTTRVSYVNIFRIKVLSLKLL